MQSNSFMTDCQSDALLRAFETRLEHEFNIGPEPPNFVEWVQSIILDGKPFSFDRHEYLMQPYEDNHPFQVYLKGAQLGLTVRAILRVLYDLRYSGVRGSLYLFPTRTDVSDFSRGRLSPLISDNEEVGKWIANTDSINLKIISGNPLYLRGMGSRITLSSVPVSRLTVDEADMLANPRMIKLALERMAHSDDPRTLLLSNPSLPDYGIDTEFQATDQRYWLMKCPHCGHHNDMVELFPDCLIETFVGVIRGCIKCQRELDPAIGQWVAKKPGVTDKRGYQFSQLYSTFIKPGDLLKEYRTTKFMQEFYNLKIGLAYIEAENRLSKEQILGLCTDETMKVNATSPTVMGVDQGKGLHCTIVGRTYKGPELLYVSERKDFEELDGLMNQFNVSRCVIDALPETRKAREFAKRHKGRVFLNWYQQARNEVRWDEKKFEVAVNRTESLDTSHKMLMDGEISLPRENDEVREFAYHCSNIAKKLETDEETGSKIYRYVKLQGPDHYRHAFNYAVIAWSFENGSYFAGLF